MKDTVHMVMDIPLSPFLVPRLQLLSSIPQEDVIFFLGIVVFVSLLHSRKKKKKVSRNHTDYEGISMKEKYLFNEIRGDVLVTWIILKSQNNNARKERQMQELHTKILFKN